MKPNKKSRSIVLFTPIAATATVTCYFENDAPIHRNHKVPVHGTTINRHHHFQEENLPLRNFFGAEITTDRQTVVQVTRGGAVSRQDSEPVNRANRFLRRHLVKP